MWNYLSYDDENLVNLVCKPLSANIILFPSPNKIILNGRSKVTLSLQDKTELMIQTIFETFKTYFYLIHVKGN